MGIAAYNRGSRAISAQIDQERRPVEFEIMERLNALGKYPDAGRLFGAVHIEADPHRPGWWWVECPLTGFGYPYESLDEAVRRWRMAITGMVGHVFVGEPR